jgi:hypothetical protein
MRAHINGWPRSFTRTPHLREDFVGDAGNEEGFACG